MVEPEDKREEEDFGVLDIRKKSRKIKQGQGKAGEKRSSEDNKGRKQTYVEHILARCGKSASVVSIGMYRTEGRRNGQGLTNERGEQATCWDEMAELIKQVGCPKPLEGIKHEAKTEECFTHLEIRI
jgi:hypothetical protein